MQVNSLGVQLGLLRAIEDCHKLAGNEVDSYLFAIGETTDLQNDFGSFRRALKHFFPQTELGFATRVFMEWMKQPDQEDLGSLRRVLLNLALEDSDLKNARAMVLSELPLNRPATPRLPTRTRSLRPPKRGAGGGIGMVERSFSEMPQKGS